MMEEKINVEKEIYNYINYLYCNYKLPEYAVTRDEIETLFNVIYTKLAEKNRINDYEAALHLVILRAAYMASFLDEDAFTINHLINGMLDLTCLAITGQEIIEMQNLVHSKIPHQFVLKKS